MCYDKKRFTDMNHYEEVVLWIMMTSESKLPGIPGETLSWGRMLLLYESALEVIKTRLMY